MKKCAQKQTLAQSKWKKILSENFCSTKSAVKIAHHLNCPVKSDAVACEKNIYNVRVEILKLNNTN